MSLLIYRIILIALLILNNSMYLNILIKYNTIQYKQYTQYHIATYKSIL